MKVVEKTMRGRTYKTVRIREFRAEQRWSAETRGFVHTDNVVPDEIWQFVKTGRSFTLTQSTGMDGLLYGEYIFKITPKRLRSLLERVLDDEWVTVRVHDNCKVECKFRARPGEGIFEDYVEFIAPCGHRGHVKKASVRALLGVLPELAA